MGRAAFPNAFYYGFGGIFTIFFSAAGSRHALFAAAGPALYRTMQQRSC
jgi:hypothetical protein